MYKIDTNAILSGDLKNKVDNTQRCVLYFVTNNHSKNQFVPAQQGDQMSL
jgi:hypothetical protein